ncbi:MAG: hypothetical protein ABI554_11230 [Flavobacterium sp.]
MKTEKFILILLLTICCTSCENDSSKDSFNKSNSAKQITVENGRIYFPDKTAFQDFYNKSKNESSDEIASLLEEEFYKKDFYSLKPIVNNDTEINEVQRHFNKIKQSHLLKSVNSKNTSLTDDTIIEHYDELDDILGDDLFQSLLNENGEIQVGDIIYVYTEYGLLFANKEYVNEIYNFMQVNQINSLGDIGEMGINQRYPSFNSNGGLKQVTSHVISFIDIKEAKKISKNPINNFDKFISIESVMATQEPIFNDVVNNLSTCNPSNPWLANLFGETKVCTTNYERKRRVKLKYYNVNLFLAYSIGVKVKHQFRGWTGIWREERTDEIALGVNSVTWFFDNSKVFNNTTNSMIVNYYITDTGKLYTSLNSYNNAIYAGTNKPIPNLPIKNLDLVIEVAADYIGKDLNEYQIRKLFYGSIYGEAQKIMKSLNKPMDEVGVIINQRGQSIVQYYNLGTKCTNCSDIQKNFDWGIVSPKITYNFGVGNGGDLKINTGFNDLKFDFKNPKVTGINVYGMAKKNGTWYGFKMVF